MEEIALIAVAFAIGGLLKGATGAGAPVVAVPLMAAFYGVPFAVAVFAVANLFMNIWQVWQFRADILPRPFALRLFVSGAIGALLGSLLLFSLPGDILKLLLVAVVVAYITLRLVAPGWTLSYKTALTFVAPTYLAAGIVQTSAGVAAPITITYLSAMRLPRPAFAGTVSLFFLSVAVTQLPTLALLGLLHSNHIFYGLLSLIPLFGAMPVGAWVANRVPAHVFDKTILAMLVVFAVKLTWDVFG